MAEPGWFEVRAVVRAPRELVDRAITAIEGSDLVEVNRVDVVALDDDLRRWDGARPPGVVVESREHDGITIGEFVARHPELLGQPEPVDVGVMDGLRRGLHLHEQ